MTRMSGWNAVPAAGGFRWSLQPILFLLYFSNLD
nr:MAG TPA: hypothetical protein [Caudoviricetes sp.]